MSTSDLRDGRTVLTGIVGDTLQPVTRNVPVDEPPELPPNSELRVIGKRVNRVDAVPKVTGQARYTYDVQLPGMLYARIVSSTVPHARIKSIDTSAAEAYPGVKAVHVLDRIMSIAQLRDPAVEANEPYPLVRCRGCGREHARGKSCRKTGAHRIRALATRHVTRSSDAG
jgi:xanthine dehydrogenase YagR molybdenum-binding subunit